MNLRNVCPELCVKRVLGTSVPDGWDGIVMEFVTKLRELLSDEYETSVFQVLQLKEKFGSIRLYYEILHPDMKEEVREKVRELVDKLEEESENVCMECGSREDVERTTGGWISTLCGSCRLTKEKNDEAV